MHSSDPLRRIVAMVEVDRADNAAATIVPDGEIDVLWTPGRVPFIAGPDTGPSPSVIDRRAPYARVQVRRGRATSLTGVGVDELTDTRVPLDAIWADPRWRRLADENDVQRGRNTLLDALRDRLADDWMPDVAVERALAGEPHGLGERQFRRRFSRAIGYGPATLQRIDRFGRLQAHCRNSPGGLADAAAAAGYADQAHLSREVKRLTGRTPTAFFG